MQANRRDIDMTESRSRSPGPEEREPPSFEEVHGRRLAMLLNTTVFIGYGSLWWVKEDVWESALAKQEYRRRMDRDAHPGLCIMKDKVFSTTLNAVAPMLHGSSNRNIRSGQLTVRDLVAGRRKPTYFGHLRPVGLGLRDFMNRDRIRRNTHKPALAQNERDALNFYLEQTGIMS